MTSINTSNLSNSSLAQQDPQDPAQLARTLRRIKRRLLLEQCGVSLPYALQSTPQVLLRRENSTIGVGMSKNNFSMERVQVESDVSPASPSME